MSSLIQYLGTRKLRWRALYVVRWFFGAVGAGWNDFYAWMLDFQDRQLTLDQILRHPRNSGKERGLWDWSRGEQYIEFFQKHGLKPNHTVLDYGCGYGRVAIPVLRHQQPGGRYIGAEISKRRLALAQEWIQREGLAVKSHELIFSKDNSMPFLTNASIDVVWVISVFNHMPDRELNLCLDAIARVLKPQGLFFGYYMAGSPSDTQSIKTFLRSDEDMADRLKKRGFHFQVLNDWDSDLGSGKAADVRMVLASKEISSLR